MDIVSCLITHEADVNTRSASCNTALIYGCAGHEKIIHTLLDSSADVEDHNEHGHIPLMEAASAGHVDIVFLLIAHGADINTQSNNTSLMYGCINGHEEVVRILLAWGADVDIPLMYECAGGHEEVVRILIDFRTNIIYNKIGCIPLIKAASAEMSCLC